MNDKKNNPWKEWELLAYEYVKNIIKDSEIHAEKHTADSHDLGFDGIWLIRSDDRALLNWLSYLLLIISHSERFL